MNRSNNASASATTPTSTPWWRVGMVWLVLGGPAAVVVAGITTAVIAVRGADVVITEPAAPSHKAAAPTAQTPAVQARNHAAAAAR